MTTSTLSTPRSAAAPFAAVAAATVLAGLALVTGVGDVATAIHAFPWEIIAIFVALEMYTGMIDATGITEVLAVRLGHRSGGTRVGIILVFALLLFTVGGFVNNLTDIVMVMPVAVVLLRSMSLDARMTNSFFAMLLAISNVSGAATPIGDFPAILILGSGLTTFRAYLVNALPLFTVTAVILVAVYCAWVRSSGATESNDPGARALAGRILDARYRHQHVDRPALIRLLVVFTAMFVAWVVLPATSVPPEATAWAGLSVAALLVASSVSATRFKAFDLGPVLMIGSFLFAAALVTTTGAMAEIATWLGGVSDDPTTVILILMVVTSLLCALVSAGPTAAAMLPVLTALTANGAVLHGHDDVVAVGFAAAICAGSSLFLTSATAGLMLSAKVSEARLTAADGTPVAWGFVQYLRYGLLNYVVQLGVAIGWLLIMMRR